MVGQYPRAVYDVVAPGVVANLLGEDWAFRHLWWRLIAADCPRFAVVLADLMAPDQHIDGTNTGKPPASVIPLPDRTRVNRQTTLMEYGVRKRPRH